MDYNLVHREGATLAPAKNLQTQSGRDEHSVIADGQFVDPATGDYRVQPNSPALALGFVNFPMDRFGVTNAGLRRIARTPVFPGQRAQTNPAWRATSQRANGSARKFANVADEGEMSAYGLPGVAGVLILEVSPRSVSRARRRPNQ
jgi:hypothetical protein